MGEECHCIALAWWTGDDEHLATCVCSVHACYGKLYVIYNYAESSDVVNFGLCKPHLTCILQVIPRLILHFGLCAGTHVFWGKFEGSGSGRPVDQRISWVKLGNLELNLSIDQPRWEGVQHNVLAMVPTAAWA